MTHALIQQEISRLKDALIEERQLLISGQPRETISLADIKLAAMDELQNAFGTLDPADVPVMYRQPMTEIVVLAKENAVHFDAIRNGLRSAIHRLESQHANAYVGSYTQTGGRVAFTEITGQFQKKA
ncbi:MAG: hypothetical protein VR75_07955 [Hyphomonadaceae bacterium BRH_c29]|nr:MAG: hypothetical protein VR75_07955 [Hyphomonadaceae bacterium BRH_c29]